MPPIATQRQRCEAKRDLDEDFSGTSSARAPAAHVCRAHRFGSIARDARHSAATPRTISTTITHSSGHCSTPTATNAAPPVSSPRTGGRVCSSSRTAVPMIRPGSGRRRAGDRVARDRLVRDRRVERRDQQHQPDRDEQDAGHRDQRTHRTVTARADDDGKVDDVRVRQHLAQADQLGELAIVEPSPLVDDARAAPTAARRRSRAVPS